MDGQTIGTYSVKDETFAELKNENTTLKREGERLVNHNRVDECLNIGL